MATPNPDDGLVPDISELYKRNRAEWQNEARRRTKLEATAEKLEQVESSLDGETCKEEKNKSRTAESEEGAKISREMQCESEIENIENSRNPKRSKLSSRK